MADLSTSQWLHLGHEHLTIRMCIICLHLEVPEQPTVSDLPFLAETGVAGALVQAQEGALGSV